jgi:hypothetical protein
VMGSYDWGVTLRSTPLLPDRRFVSAACNLRRIVERVASGAAVVSSAHGSQPSTGATVYPDQRPLAYQAPRRWANAIGGLGSPVPGVPDGYLQDGSGRAHSL